MILVSFLHGEAIELGGLASKLWSWQQLALNPANVCLTIPRPLEGLMDFLPLEILWGQKGRVDSVCAAGQSEAERG